MAWQSFVCAGKGDFGLVFRSLGTVFMPLLTSLSSYFWSWLIDFTNIMQAGMWLCFGDHATCGRVLGGPLFFCRDFCRLCFYFGDHAKSGRVLRTMQ